MEPIVNPWLIYAIAKVDVVCSVFVLATVLSACAFIFAFMATVTEDYPSDKMEASIKKSKTYISCGVYNIYPCLSAGAR